MIGRAEPDEIQFPVPQRFDHGCIVSCLGFTLRLPQD
jgi:hypothetical protein